MLGPGRTLRFDGVPRGREFQIGSIRIVQDGGQLPYEASAEIIPYRDKSKVQGNFLDGILDKTVSLVRHTEQKLRTWEEYLDWKQELSGKGLVGCRYFAAEPGQAQQDRKRPGLIFGLIFELEEDFELIRRELRSGMEVYGRDYSKDKWRFVYEYDPKARFQSWRLGSFRGVESAGFSDRKELEKRYKVLKDCPFEKPYIVWARYDISEEDSESLDHSRMSPSEFMKSVLLKRLPADGFLALSFVQDFALIKRFRIAIRNLRDGDCDSPNLPLWLFDATQARLPRPEDFLKSLTGLIRGSPKTRTSATLCAKCSPRLISAWCRGLQAPERPRSSQRQSTSLSGRASVCSSPRSPMTQWTTRLSACRRIRSSARFACQTASACAGGRLRLSEGHGPHRVLPVACGQDGEELAGALAGA